MPDATHSPHPPLLARLALDALSEFGRAIEHVPPPGRGGPIGRLNSAARTIGHAATTLDTWVNMYSAGASRDEWCERVRSLPDHAPIAFDDASAAFDRVATRAAPYLEKLDHPALTRTARTRPGSPLEGLRVGHLLARTVAHLFAHAGELTVVASLLRRPDLGLPGSLPCSYHAPIDADAISGARPAIVRLALDAREAFSQVADLVPVPAQAGAFDRLNSGGWIVAHIAEQEDQYWSVHAQGLEPDPWLTAALVRFGDPTSKPRYVEARAALDRAITRATRYVEALDADGLDRVLRISRLPERGEQRAQDLLVLQATHLYALAGELAAIASLAGAPDPGLPMTMQHTVEAAETST